MRLPWYLTTAYLAGFGHRRGDPRGWADRAKQYAGSSPGKVIALVGSRTYAGTRYRLAAERQARPDKAHARHHAGPASSTCWIGGPCEQGLDPMGLCHADLHQACKYSVDLWPERMDRRAERWVHTDDGLKPSRHSSAKSLINPERCVGRLPPQPDQCARQQEGSVGRPRRHLEQIHGQDRGEGHWPLLD